MRIQALLLLTVLGLMAYQAIGLPIFEKELLRVKRKGETEDDGQRLHRRDLDLLHEIENLEDNDVEIRRKRRFYTEENHENQDLDKYPNKMAARSSRSSREDNDVTARGIDRFVVQGKKQPAKQSETGSGMEDASSGSASGVWVADTNQETPSGKQESPSLENMVAALSDDGTSSGSGLWGASGSDDDLPKFFSAAATNLNYMESGRVASGSGDDKQANLVSDLAEELHQQTSQKQVKQDEQDKPVKQDKPADPKQDKPLEPKQGKPVKPVESVKDEVLEAKPDQAKQDKPEEAELPGPVHPKQKRSSEALDSGNSLLRRFFDGPGIIHRAKREKIDNSLEERLASFFRNLKDDTVSSHEPNTPNEPPPIPAITTKRKSKVTKTARDLGKLQENKEELTGLNLVKRFYRDQDMDTTPQSVKVVPNSVSPLNIVSPLNDKQTIKKEKIETEPTHVEKIEEKPLEETEIKREKLFEPRVVHQKEVPRAHVTIIEEPAVYSKADDGMDTSDGGEVTEDDESEPAIEIHERDIREDGYVGCYADQSPDRDLPIPVSVRNLTPKSCRIACKDAGHAYAGLQYGYLCRCGDNYGKYQRLDESQCSTACKGDKTQICGGFFRSSIYATDGVTEPNRGDFLHVESVRPLNTPIKPPSATPNFMPAVTAPQPYLQPNPLSYSSGAAQLRPSYVQPEEPKIIYHSETPMADIPVNIVKAEVIQVPRNRGIESTLTPVKRSTVSKTVTPKPPPAPVKPNYLHKQHVSVKPVHKPTVNYFRHLITNPATQMFTGTVKLKQTWLDGLTKPKSPEYKILSGNIEEALKNMFKKDPKFISAKVHGFSKGLVKHNPSTVRKVVAAFSLTFQRGIKGIEKKVLEGVKKSGKLFDMPAYKKSIKIEEYLGGTHAKPHKAKIHRKRDISKQENKATNSKLPYTLELFLMKDQLERQKRSDPK